MANNDKQIVLGLDIPKTAAQINKDIKKLQGQLAKVKATGALDTSATVKQINSQIAALQSQLKNIDIKINIDTKDVNKAARQTGADIAQNIASGISQSGDKVDSAMQKLVDQQAELQECIQEISKDINSGGQDEINNTVKETESGLAKLAAFFKSQISQIAQNLGTELFAMFKNVGSPKMFGLKIVLNIPTVCQFCRIQ
ncbi:MAG: hypothetical protein K2J60_13435 [Acetatifactor sp.]|nr:hypothetical protein [Acetatifactor sp.]